MHSIKLGEYKMSFHEELEEWEELHKKENCPICNDDAPPDNDIIIAEFKNSWLLASPDVCLKGTCCMGLRSHAVEIFDIPDSELLEFMKEVKVVSKALKEVTNAKKINYEIHGNTIPHLHMHLFPRYVDDPFPGGPIDYNRIEPAVYNGNEFDEFVEALQKKISAHEWPS